MANPDVGTTTLTLLGGGTYKITDVGTTTFAVVSSGAQNPDYGFTTIAISTPGDGGSIQATQTFDPNVYQDCIAKGEPRALRMLDYLPPYFQEDPTIKALVCAYAKELSRIQAKAEALRQGAFPDQADLRTLAYYEKLFGLSNTALSIDNRRLDVLAHMRKRKVATRFDWQTALATFIGAGWTYSEGAPGTFNILLTTPVDPTGTQTALIAAYARAITPAHLNLIVNGAYGNFKVGISFIGIDPL